MKALVTGGGGFLGSAIVQRLCERGWQVRSFSRHRYPQLDAWGVESIVGDLGNASEVTAAVASCDVVFHVAAKAGIWGSVAEYHTANVIGTQHILEACRRGGVGKLVFTSSPSVTFAGSDQEGVNESSPYPRRFLAAYPQSKAEAERAVLAANNADLLTVSLRPHLIWGPGDPHLVPRLVAKAKQGKLRRIGSRPNLVDTTFVDNAADAHLCAVDRLTHGSPIAGRAYFISNGEPLPLWDFINRILAVHGVEPVTRSIPAWLAYLAGVILETGYRWSGRCDEPPMTRFVARQLATAHWFDLSAARRDLGYEPRVSVAEGLRRLAESLS